MTRQFDIVTFDCYGTLINWEEGISGAFARAAASAGMEVDRTAVLAAHERIERRVEAEHYRPYREVLGECAVLIAAECRGQIEPGQAGFLAGSLEQWRPFDDTVPALQRLVAAGFSLGILSNVDDDLLDGSRRLLVVPFELVVTAQQVRSYKPAHGHFLEASRRIGSRRWLHAARSYFHDVEPCVELGIPVVWVNRSGERAPRAARPNWEVGSLEELARLLCGMSEG
jgi:2-haloacid dehalogenase/putative hydrolase of the HAD superfamily